MLAAGYAASKQIVQLVHVAGRAAGRPAARPRGWRSRWGTRLAGRALVRAARRATGCLAGRRAAGASGGAGELDTAALVLLAGGAPTVHCKLDEVRAVLRCSHCMLLADW